MTTKTTFIITVRAEDHPTPSAIRLRQALKILLRAFSLRAIDVREAGTTSTARPHNEQGQKAPERNE